MRSITKVLSPNDVGDTGTHQAGLLVPKDSTILEFFPALDSTLKNPRATITCGAPDGTEWEFCFIYYNNSRFGGTRNEYRLTKMTRFFRHEGLRAGDHIVFAQNGHRRYRLEYERLLASNGDRPKVLALGSTWKVVSLKR